MIRKANNSKEDIEAIYEIISVAARENLILPRTVEEIGEVIEGFFVAVEDGCVVGCCAIEIYNEKLAEIRSLAVLPEYQKNGFGQRLVNACVAFAIDRGIREVLTITDKDAFFEKSGFLKTLNGQWAMFMKLK